ncbi:TetR/AcrR family transcriptional regulator [Nocardia arthritidis]|uniref:TetR family transcriptional regulator n=1 Tax=Nocardia arthritidis TaxID=228602 RepID=A0A6G9YI79_9NOCA|nr:TetR/AcrR family transcriptional regulator [Nocardia arthritidis]QIS12901.1 TetR family transcriptional regulator [Nocardia arthritidis]
MARASKAEAQSHRREVVDAAAAQVRARGANGVTVPEVMAAAGLTHGGFYRHFRSKDDLIAQACTAAYVEKIGEMERIIAAAPDAAAARRTFIERYLSVEHRDTASRGCGIAALAGDVARAESDSALRRAYRDGIRNMIGKLGEFGDRPADGAELEHEVLVEVSVLAGALMLARASAGDPVSERILAAAKDFLLDE